MFLELEFEELENAFDLELEQVTEISDGGYDRGYGDAMEETEAEATIQEDLLSQVSEALQNKVSGYERGKKEGFAEALDKRTNLVVTANGEYTPTGNSTGFRRVVVNVKAKSKISQMADGTIKEITEEELQGITELKTYAFAQNKLLERVAIPDTVTKTGMYIFESCTSLSDVKFSKNISTINNSSFYICSSLKEFVVSDNVTQINSQAFAYCYALSKITIGEKVSSMSTQVFLNCTALKTVMIRATKPPTIQSNTFQGVPSDCVFTVPYGSGNAYRTATNWSALANQIVEGDV